MRFTRTLVWLALLGTPALLLGLAGRAAAAQPETQAAAESSCLSCHENLYYSRDLGRHYCLTEASSRCVDCHDGDPQAAQKDPAHLGLVAYPVVGGDISRCQSCHRQDAGAHVERLAALVGFSTVIQAIAPGPARQPDAQPVQGVPAAAGIAILLGAIIGLLGFCALTQRGCHG